HVTGLNIPPTRARGRSRDMIALEPIGDVRSRRSDLADDNWGSVVARIQLVESLPAESLEGIEAFSHAEVVFYFDRVPDPEVEPGARHPCGNTAWPKVGIFAQRSKGRPNRLGPRSSRSSVGRVVPALHFSGRLPLAITGQVPGHAEHFSDRGKRASPKPST